MQTPNQIDDIIKLTPQANGLLFHALKEGNKTYHVGVAFSLVADCSEREIRQIWDQIQRAQPALRSVFTWQQSRSPHQIILKAPRVSLDYSLLSDQQIAQQVDKGTGLSLSDAECENRIRQYSQDWIQRSKVRPFELEQEVFRIACFHCPDRNILEVACSFHHILMDGWSSSVMINMWVSALRGQLQNVVHPSDYAKQLWAGLSDADLEQSRTYWQKIFAHSDQHKGMETMLLSQPLFQQAPSSSTQELKKQRLSWSSERVQAIETLCREAGVTTATFVYFCWSIMLAKMTYQECVAFGCTFSGRHSALSEATTSAAMGLFINTLPLVISLDTRWTLKQALQAVFKQLQDAQSHEKTPPLLIREAADKKSDFYDTMVVFDNYPVEADMTDLNKGAALRSVFNAETTHYPITLTVSGDQTWQLELLVNAQHSVVPLAMDTLVEGFESIACSALATTLSQPLSTLSFNIKAPSETSSYSVVQGTTKDEVLPANGLLSSIYNRLVKHPQKSQLQAQGEVLTNGQLCDAISNVQHLLKKHGFVVGERVAVHCQKGSVSTAAILAIVFLGGSYLYVNPADPSARKTQLLELAGCQMVLSDDKEALFEAAHQQLVISVSDITHSTNALGQPELYKSRSLEQEFYFIFTSGTTGTPKGISVKDKSLANLIDWFVHSMALSEQDRVFGLTELNFDPSVEDLFGSLFAGATVIYPKPEVLLDRQAFVKQMQIANISVVNFIPGAIAHLLEGAPYLPAMKHWIFGGEALPKKLRDGLLQQGYQVHNHYGPSEATVDCLTATQQLGQPVNIGWPIQNVTAMATDIFGQPVPAGIKGELRIGGVGIAQGYENNDEESQRAFQPYLEQSFYRTGDFVCFNDEHGFSYWGRIDDQAKINGVRIEPAEIEHTALMLPDVADAILLPLSFDDGHSAWWLFVEGETSETDLEHGVREHLRRLLPQTWMPSGVTSLPNFPRTKVGKIHRQRLMQIAQDAREKEATQIATDVSEDPIIGKLQSVWGRVLGKQMVDVHTNFFDAGGNSLKMINLQSDVQRAFELPVNVATLFEYPSIASFSTWLSAQLHQQVDQVKAELNADGKSPSSKNISRSGRNRLSGRRKKTKDIMQYDS